MRIEQSTQHCLLQSEIEAGRRLAAETVTVDVPAAVVARR